MTGGVQVVRGGLARWVTGGVLALALVLQGCATVPARVEANDPCSVHRQPMVEAQERFNQTIAAGAVSGAVLGAVIGGLATGDWGGALAGAAIGGLSGAATGYLQAKSEQAQNRAQVIDAINQDVRSSRRYISSIGEGVRRLNTCRANEVADLQRRVASGQIGGAAARAELDILRERIADDRRLVNAVMGDVNENNGVYADALAKTRGVDREIIVSERAVRYDPVVTGAASVRGERQYATAGVNVRTGPGTQHSRIGTFRRGQRVGVLGSQGGWSRVDYGGRDAWVASRFLSPNRPSAQAASAPAVPTVDKSKRPAPKSDVEALYLEAADIQAEDAAFEATINEDLEAIEALTL